MLRVYTAAIFLSATLLFLVQPIVGKLVLPSLGGTPAVWNTCMVFFQSLLLVGYAYAHLLATRLGARAQALVHVAAVAAPLALLPIALPRGLSVPTGEFPIPWLLGVLGLMAGGPFLALSANGPLLQRWFSATDHRLAANPYFLYAASNLGSLIALLGYPVLIEPWLTLRQQGVAWSVGYGLLAALIVACAAYRVGRARPESAAAGARAGGAEPVTWERRLLWVALSFAPSSLMIGATTFISTDLAPVPLLWVIPLAIYLGTMIVAFSGLAAGATRLATATLPVMVLALTVSLLMEARKPIGVLVPLHLVTLAAAAMACHGRLSLLRPGPARLTEYYLLMSLGGALGGLFNGIVAPLAFSRVLEYPIALVMSVGLALALAARGAGATRGAGAEGGAGPDRGAGTPSLFRELAGVLGAITRRKTARDAARRPPAPRTPAPAWIVPVGFGALLLLTSLYITARTPDPNWKVLTVKLYVPAGAAAAMMIAGLRAERSRWRRWLLNLSVPVGMGALYVCMEFANGEMRIVGTARGNALSYGLPVLGCFLLTPWAWRFTGSVGMLLALATYSPGTVGRELLIERTFFGVHRVTLRPERTAIELLHGNTQHGAQITVDGFRRDPVTYYARISPIGDIFRLLNGENRLTSVGCVGLGVGTLATYCRPGQTFTFYEIDPSIVRVASDPQYFTFLRDAEGSIEFKIGDGRLVLDRAEGVTHDLIVLDAFSSDSIPMHLLTVEAMQVYFKRLSEHGVLAVHTSNRHLSLSRVLTGNAGRLGLAIRAKYFTPSANDQARMINSSEWIVLARRREDLEFLDRAPEWHWLECVPGVSKVWTDDFSDILGVMDKVWSGE